MESIKTNDALEYAQQLIEKCFPHLPGRGRHKVGQFEYLDEYHHNFRISYGKIDSIVCFHLGAMRTPAQFYELAYWEKGVRHTLLPNGIRFEDQNYEKYPHFDYTWVGGNHDPNDKGKLDFLRVDLAGDTFVNYNCLIENQHLHKIGQPQLLIQLPNSIKDVNEILGRPIPWSINYDNVSWEILNKSGLEQFVEKLVPKVKT